MSETITIKKDQFNTMITDAATNPIAQQNVSCVYELIDTTGDEMYYPLGVFLSLEEARSAILNWDNETAVSEHADDYEDLTIVKREIGFSGNGERVETIRRASVYSEEFDDSFWQVVEESE